MNYAYDILLNFKDNFIDFFEWNLSDDIFHIKKIPIIKIERYKLLEIKNCNIKVSNVFLKQIFNKTEFFNNSSKLKYCCIVGNDENLMGINFNSEGYLIGRSDLLLHENVELLEVFNSLDASYIKYEIFCKRDLVFKTRNEKEEISYVKNRINSLNIQELKYLYYECFNKKKNNVDKIKNYLLNNLDNNLLRNKVIDFYNVLPINK